MDLSQTTLGYTVKMQMKNPSHDATQFPSLLRKLAAFISAPALFALALMFSVLLIALVLAAGAMAWGYLWWRTRELRKPMRMHPAGKAVIEGEVIRVDAGDRR